MKLIENYSLKNLNTFGIEASTKYFAEILSEEELVELLSDEKSKNEKKIVLGAGSNILFTNNFNGLLIKNSISTINVLKENDDSVLIEAGAGVIWNDLVKFCVERNFGGIENLTLIPGTVGAAPIQNIGAYGKELADTFYSLNGFYFENCEKNTFSKSDCKFSYRSSIFKENLKDKFIITSIKLKLNKIFKLNTSYKTLYEYLEKAGIKGPTIRNVSNAVAEIRRSKLPDPSKVGNAGSFFKNPEVDYETLEKLKSEYPDMLAGQGGLMLARAVIGWGQRVSFARRLRAILPDLATLVGGIAVLLIWAGVIESFLSQYHAPVLPYSAKIVFGVVQFALLVGFLTFAGRSKAGTDPDQMIAPAAISRGRTNSLVIRLPEGVDFALPLAGPLSRFLALTVDVGVYFSICWVVGQVMTIFGVLSRDIVTAVLILAYFLVPIAYGIVCEWLLRGQTLGKRLLRLRVMDATGLRLSFSQVLMRNLLRAVDSLPALYLVGGMVCLLSRRGQRLGDLAAGTVVVRLPEDRTTDLAALGLQFKFNSLRENAVLAARLRQRVPPAVAAIALRALLRREQLDPEPRLEIFRELAAQLKALVPYPEEVTADLSDEAYVRNVVEIVFQSSALASTGKRAIMPPSP